MVDNTDSALPGEAVDAIWNQQMGYLGALRGAIGGGGQRLSAYLEEIGATGLLFRDGVPIAACMDEGASPGLPGGTPVAAVRSAGAGILAESIGAAADQIDNFGEIKTVLTHQECGAARLAAARAFGIPEDEAGQIKHAVVDNFAWCWGKQLAAHLSRRHGKYVGHKHLSLDEMSRPAKLHTAAAVYYDGHGNFNRVGIAQMPRGFVISRFAMPAEHGKFSLSIAASIALGEHGFGARFTPEAPFCIIVVGAPGDGDCSKASLIGEAQEVAEDFAGRVAVLGFDGY